MLWDDVKVDDLQCISNTCACNNEKEHIEYVFLKTLLHKAVDTRFNICWTVCRVMLNVEICHSTRWTLLNELEQKYRDQLYSVQHVCATFFHICEQQMLQDVEPCVICLRFLVQYLFKVSYEGGTFRQVVLNINHVTDVELHQLRRELYKKFMCQICHARIQ